MIQTKTVTGSAHRSPSLGATVTPGARAVQWLPPHPRASLNLLRGPRCPPDPAQVCSSEGALGPAYWLSAGLTQRVEGHLGSRMSHSKPGVLGGFLGLTEPRLPPWEAWRAVAPAASLVQPVVPASPWPVTAWQGPLATCPSGLRMHPKPLPRTLEMED